MGFIQRRPERSAASFRSFYCNLRLRSPPFRVRESNEVAGLDRAGIRMAAGCIYSFHGTEKCCAVDPFKNDGELVMPVPADAPAGTGRF
jgi:hypothetical protein